MPNFILSPNMMLPVPVVGQEPGPQYATDLNNSLNIVDAHNHSAGSGVQVNPDGIFINADLTFNNSNSATDVKTLRFNPQLSAISAVSPNLGCLYEAGVDLYYNDGAGNQIRITQGGSVTGASGTITGLPSGTASAAYSSSSGTFVFQQATATAANLDVGSIAIRYPGSYPSPSGNYIQIQAPSSLASGYSLTLPGLPALNFTFLTINTDGTIVSAVTPDNNTVQISSNQLMVKPLGITSAELASNSVITSKILNSNVTAAKIETDVNLPGSGVQVNGKKVITANTNAAANLVIIRGEVTGGGGIGNGEGFSASSPGTGLFNVSFSSAMGDSPVILINMRLLSALSAGQGHQVLITGFNASGFTYACYVNGTLSNQGALFTAIGQRA